jgi:hypothetical protein
MKTIAMLEGWTITSVETIENYSREDDTCLSILDEIKNVSLANTEDSADVTGKNGQALFTIKKGKAVTGSGSSGYISGNLMALQTGAEPTEGKIKFRKREIVKFGKDDTSINLSETAVGTEGNEILNLIVTVTDENGDVSTQYEQATAADTSKFAYADNVVTLPTATNGKNGTVEVIYEYEKDGASVGNKSGTYGKTTHTFINCLGTNTCDETYFIQIEVYRCDWNSNFTFELGGDGVEHPFEFKSLVDKCSGEDRFWDFKVYKKSV